MIKPKVPSSSCPSAITYSSSNWTCGWWMYSFLPITADMDMTSMLNSKFVLEKRPPIYPDSEVLFILPFRKLLRSMTFEPSSSKQWGVVSDHRSSIIDCPSCHNHSKSERSSSMLITPPFYRKRTSTKSVMTHRDLLRYIYVSRVNIVSSLGTSRIMMMQCFITHLGISVA